MVFVKGGTIPDGDTLRLSTTGGFPAYVFVGKTMLSNSGGIIPPTIVAKGGNVVFCIDKRATAADISGSGLDGSLVYDGLAPLNISGMRITATTDNKATGVDCYGDVNLTTLVADKATTIYAEDAAINAQSIGNFLLAAIANHPTATGTANFSGGDNATTDLVNAYLITKGTTLAAVTSALATWTITIDAP